MIEGALTVGGRERGFVMRRPADVPDETPLVLVLHGNYRHARGRHMREWTTFDKQADLRGFAVAYPDGYRGCWADGRGVTTADEAGVDDVAFLRALIGWAAERHGTYGDRALVAGVSNGAFMAHRMALDASDQVAVVAAVAGGLPAYLRDRQPAHAVSAMLIHGTADTICPIEGGYSRHRGPNGELRGRTLSLDETAEFWRTVDRCPPGPGETRPSAFSRRTTASGGVGGTAVAAWTVVGGGHAWPGSQSMPSQAERTVQEFDAAEEICRFAAPLLVPADVRRL